MNVDIVTSTIFRMHYYDKCIYRCSCCTNLTKEALFLNYPLRKVQLVEYLCEYVHVAYKTFILSQWEKLDRMQTARKCGNNVFPDCVYRENNSQTSEAPYLISLSLYSVARECLLWYIFWLINTLCFSIVSLVM